MVLMNTVSVRFLICDCFFGGLFFFCFLETGLDLNLLKTVLPDSSERGDTVLTEIDEDVHAVGVHRLVHEDIVVVVVGEDLLDGSGSATLEFLDGFFGGTVFLELVVDALDIGCTLN